MCKWYRVTEHRRDLEVLKASVEINETSYQHKPNGGGQCSNNYNNNRSNSQGFKSYNSFNGKTAYNNSPKVQCKFCFGPREIFKICKLLEENANNPKQSAEVKSQNLLLISSRTDPVTLHILKKLNLKPWLSSWTTLSSM